MTSLWLQQHNYASYLAFTQQANQDYDSHKAVITTCSAAGLLGDMGHMLGCQAWLEILSTMGMVTCCYIQETETEE